MPSSKGPSDNRREAAKARADANARLSAAHQSGIEVGRNEEKARIRAAVEGLAILDYSVVTYVDGGKGKPVPYMAEEDYYVKRAAVLRIIDGEDTDERP